jgi:hypothetical protein
MLFVDGSNFLIELFSQLGGREARRGADLGNSLAIAKAVVQQLGDVKPPMPVEEIAAAVGISQIQLLQTTAFEGALITDDCKQGGIILVNASSRTSADALQSVMNSAIS